MLGVDVGDGARDRLLERHPARLVADDVRQLLGRPSSNEVVDHARPHRGYSYVVGYAMGRGSDDEDKLTVEFDRGRVVYAPALGRERPG
ncbi:MAG: outer membrane protein assembly factor BamE, partial [Actinobacteria bacterium]|nr:outer membrane protein assembly factor BamE [Actinomycetota bacterium]